MALRDTWHRTLVYFGLAEPDEGYADEPEPEPERELEERYTERPNVRRLQTRRRRDEIDDIFADESPRSATRQTRVLRPVGNGRSGNGVQVHTSLADAEPCARVAVPRIAVRLRRAVVPRAVDV